MLKRLLRYKVTIVFVLFWMVFSAVGKIGRGTVYKNYALNQATTPYFVLVLEGIHDGIYPWSIPLEDVNPGAGVEYASVSGREVRAATATHVSAAETKKADVGVHTDAEADVADVSGKNGAPAGSSEPGQAKNVPVISAQEGDAAGTPGEGTARQRRFVAVDKSWFDDAVFIGDSRTVGIDYYSGLDNATFFATVGMNVYDLWKDKFCEVEGEKVTLEEALSQKQYGKIYFQIGINEMGTGTVDRFMAAYEASLDKFREMQPDAIIYVQAIMHVTTKKSKSDDIYNNENIDIRNNRIAQLADGVKVFYIDINEVVCDESGGLSEKLTFDNLHLYASKYAVLVDYLESKGIE